LSNAEVEEIYRIRQRLEPEVMAQAIQRLTEDHLQDAESILSRAEAEDDPASWFDLNRQFHRVFIKAAQSPRLENIVEALNDSAALYVVSSWEQGAQTKAEADAQHRQIIQAARDRDVALAEALVVLHVRTTVSRLAQQV
jgi:DNA-binding GntR family transcriptional regulator